MGNLQFIYDPFDRLIRIVESEKIQDLLYLDQDEIGIVEKGIIKELKLIDPNTAVSYGVEKDGVLSSVVHDHIGNIAVVVDAESKVTDRTYTAYSPVGSSVSTWGFSGKREIGDLVYFGRRFYSPKIGRWITPDPISFEDGPNLYAFFEKQSAYPFRSVWVIWT